MKIGICGGTFDPFHRGHLDPILAARETMEWDRVLYVPAYVQPFKRDREATSGHHRFAMVAMVTIHHEALFVSPMELERGAVSYTVDTLQELRSAHPDATLDWIIGDDNLGRLHEWRSLDRIFEMANFAVLTRGGATVPSYAAARVVEPKERPRCGAIAFAHNPTVPISATDIRRRVRAGEPIDGLVDPLVSRYIQRYALYRALDKGSPA